MSTNLNQLYGKDFRLEVDRLPLVKFFCNKIAIPSISSSSVSVANPFTPLSVPGDKLVFSPLNITFNLDEDLQNYKEIFNWMVSYGFPHEHKQYDPTARGPKKAYSSQYSEASLFTSTNKDNPNIEFRFEQIFPVELGEIQLDTQVQDPVALTCTATFAYTKFTIV